MNNIWTTTVLLMALCTAVTSAEEPYKSGHVHKAEDPTKFQIGDPLYSGPQPGETLTGFTVNPLKRNYPEEEFDPVALAAGKPHFLIFIDDSDIAEGVGAFMNAARWVDELSQTGLAATVVILSHDRKSEIAFTTMSEGVWKIFNAAYRIGYSADGRDGPPAYGLNRNLPMTIILADAEGKVLYNFPFREIPPDTPNAYVLGGLAGAVGEDRETVDSWLNNNISAYEEWLGGYKGKKIDKGFTWTSVGSAWFFHSGNNGSTEVNLFVDYVTFSTTPEGGMLDEGGEGESVVWVDLPDVDPGSRIFGWAGDNPSYTLSDDAPPGSATPGSYQLTIPVGTAAGIGWGDTSGNNNSDYSAYRYVNFYMKVTGLGADSGNWGINFRNDGVDAPDGRPGPRRWEINFGAISNMPNYVADEWFYVSLPLADFQREEPYRSKHVYTAEDPTKFQIGEPIYSGPQPGETLTGFTVNPPRSNHLEEEFDPVTDALGKPHFLMFIDDSDTAEAIGAFINAAWMVDKESQTGLAASVVILARDAGSAFWEIFNAVYRIGYAPDGRDGPPAYGLNRNLPLTILIADAEGKVLYNFPFRHIPQDWPDPHVVGGLAAAVGEDRETVASWLNNNPPVHPDRVSRRNKEMKNKEMKK